MKRQWMVFACCMAACLCLGGCGQSGQDAAEQEQELDLAHLEQLQIQMRSGEVRVHPTDGTARAVFQNSRGGFSLGSAPELEIVELDGRTELNVTNPVRVGFGQDERVLDLYLPNDQTIRKLDLLFGSTTLTCEEFRIDEMYGELGSGSVTLRNVIANKVDFTSESGKLFLEDCMVGHAVLNIQSGEIDANFTNGKTDLDVRVLSGKAKVEGSFELIRSDCKSGELEVRSDYPSSFLGCRMGSGRAVFFVPESERGFHLQTKLTNGTIASEFTGEQDKAAGTLLVGEGFGDYQLTVESGRIDLNRG